MKTVTLLGLVLVLTPKCTFATEEARCSGADVEVVSTVLPKYPLVEFYEAGWVAVRVIVDEHGAASQVSVIKAEPAHLFESAAVDAVRQWKFSESDRATRCAEYTVEFRLK